MSGRISSVLGRSSPPWDRPLQRSVVSSARPCSRAAASLLRRRRTWLLMMTLVARRASPPASTMRVPCATPCCRPGTIRSEEHTSELQSRGQLVCRLLLEKKNIKDNVGGYDIIEYQHKT